MAATTIHLSQYCTKRKYDSYRSSLRVSTSEIPVYFNVCSTETVTCFNSRSQSFQSPIGINSQNLVTGRKVYRRLSPNSRKTLSRGGGNENVRALLGYIKKKRQTENTRELPARRRRSRLKKSKLQRSRKTQRQVHGNLLTESDITLAQMRVPHLLNQSFFQEYHS